MTAKVSPYDDPRGRRAVIEIGSRRYDCTSDAAGHWCCGETGRVWSSDGMLLWEPRQDVELPSDPHRPALCRIKHPYLGAPKKPLPYARRLRDLRLAARAETLGWGVLFVLAGPCAWEIARADLDAANPRFRLRPFVLLPPGDDPLSYDWSPLGLWRRSVAERKAWQAGAASDPGPAWGVRVQDWDAPCDWETREAIAVACIDAGCAWVDVHDKGAPNGVRQYVAQEARAAA